MVPVKLVIDRSLSRIALESLPLGIGLGLAILLLLAQFGCSSSGGNPPPGGGQTGPEMQADFTPPSSGHYDFGKLPWPNDLYRGANGHIALGSIPDLAGSNYATALIDGLSDLDGFGVTTGVFMTFDADLAPVTVNGQNAYLVSLSGSGRGKVIPLVFHYDVTTHRLAALPAPGNVLVQKTTYAFVMTTDVKGADGHNVSQPKNLTDALAGQGPAGQTYAPLAQWLSEQHTDAKTIAAATVFTTQSITSELEQARTIIWGGTAPRAHLTTSFPNTNTTLDQLLGTPAADLPGLDNAGVNPSTAPYAIAHTHISRVIYGTVDVTAFNSSDPGTGGKFLVNAQGQLTVKGTNTVPFTLTLPQTISTHTPVVVFTHSIQSSRVQAFGVADTLAAQGFAVIAADLPFHGQRNPLGQDQRNNLTGEMVPDGIKDDSGLIVASMFFGISGNGDLLALHPALVRDNLRQAAVEQIALARLVAQGNWSEVQASDASLAQLGFDAQNVYAVAEGLGTFAAMEASTVEPTFRAQVFSVAGGGLVFPTLVNSPSYSPQFTPIVMNTLSLDANIDWAGFHPMFQPMVNLFQTVTDRGDPLAYAPYVIRQPLAGRQPANLLVSEAFRDEALPNHSSESLAAALGTPAVTMNGTMPNIRYVASGMMQSASAPVARNMGNSTAGFVQFDPSPGSLLLKQKGEHDYQAEFPPFVRLSSVEMVDNPILKTQAQMSHFLTSIRDTGTATIIDPFQM
jgi:hypothetical protein